MIASIKGFGFKRLLAGASLFLVVLVFAQCSHHPPVTPPEEGAAPATQPPGQVEESGPYNILSYSVDVRRNGILIEVMLREPLHFEWFLTNGEWINLTFDHGRLNPDKMHAIKPHAEVLEVVAHQFDNSAQLSFRMTSPVEKYRVTTDPYSPKRVLVMITGSTRGMIEDEVFPASPGVSGSVEEGRTKVSGLPVCSDIGRPDTHVRPFEFAMATVVQYARSQRAVGVGPGFRIAFADSRTDVH